MELPAGLLPRPSSSHRAMGLGRQRGASRRCVGWMWHGVWVCPCHTPGPQQALLLLSSRGLGAPEVLTTTLPPPAHSPLPNNGVTGLFSSSQPQHRKKEARRSFHPSSKDATLQKHPPTALESSSHNRLNPSRPLIDPVSLLPHPSFSVRCPSTRTPLDTLPSQLSCLDLQLRDQSTSQLPQGTGARNSFQQYPPLL